MIITTTNHTGEFMKYSHFRKEALMYKKNIITEQYKTKNPMYLKLP